MRQFRQWILFGTLLGTFSGVTAFAKSEKPKLTLQDATAIATKKVAGTVKSSEFEHEMGLDVYSFDIVGKDNAIHEILVDANNGKIVSNKVETASAEAKEAAEKK